MSIPYYGMNNVYIFQDGCKMNGVRSQLFSGGILGGFAGFLLATICFVPVIIYLISKHPRRHFWDSGGSGLQGPAFQSPRND